MPNSANQRLAVNTIFLGIRMIVVLLISLYTTRVLLKALGVEDFGIYNIVSGFVAMCAFISTSMANGIQRFFNYEYGANGEEGACRVFNIGILIQLILVVLILLISEPIGIWYVNEKLVASADRIIAANWIFQFSLIVLSISMFRTTFTAAVMAHEKMGFFAVISILDAVLKLSIAIVIKNATCDRLILYGVLLIIVNVVNMSITVVYSKIHFSEIRFKKNYDSRLLKSMLSFSGWNLFGSFGNTFKDQGLNIVLNFFYGPVVNAARGIASQVAGGFQQLIAAVITAARPQIVQSYAQENYTRTMSIMMSISKLTTLLLYVTCYPIILEINYVLQIWLGNNVPQDTGIFIIVIIATAFINNLNACVSAVVHATGKMKTYQTVGALFSVAVIPVAYYLCKLGAAPIASFWLCFVFTMFGHVSSLLIIKNLVKFSINDYLKGVLLPVVFVALLSFIFPFIPIFLMPSNFLRFCIVTVVSVLATSLSAYFVGLNKMEKTLVNSFVIKK